MNEENQVTEIETTEVPAEAPAVEVPAEEPVLELTEVVETPAADAPAESVEGA